MFNRMKEKKEVDRQKKAKQKISDELFSAVSNSDLDAVINIVNEHGTDPEIINVTRAELRHHHKCHGKTVLIHAVRIGNVGVVNALLKAPCINANLRDDEMHPGLASGMQNNNALLAAVNNKNLAIVEILANRVDVNVNAVASGGETPLICAVENFPAAVPVLLAVKGINPNAKNHEGKTALHLACLRRNPMQSDMPPYMKELLSHALTKFDVADNAGFTPLMYAIKRNDQSLIYELSAYRRENQYASSILRM